MSSACSRSVSARKSAELKHLLRGWPPGAGAPARRRRLLLRPRSRRPSRPPAAQRRRPASRRSGRCQRLAGRNQASNSSSKRRHSSPRPHSSACRLQRSTCAIQHAHTLRSAAAPAPRRRRPRRSRWRAGTPGKPASRSAAHASSAAGRGSTCGRQPGDDFARERRAVVTGLDQGAERFHDALGAVLVDHRDAQPQQRGGPVQRLGDAGLLLQLHAAHALHEGDDLLRQLPAATSGAFLRTMASSLS